MGKSRKINIAHPEAIQYMRDRGCAEGLAKVQALIGADQMNPQPAPVFNPTSSFELDANLIVKGRPRVVDELPPEIYPPEEDARREKIVLPISRNPSNTGELEYLVTQAEFCSLAGVIPQGVSVKVRKGGSFHKRGAVVTAPTYATRTPRAFINMMHPYIINYLKDVNRHVIVEKVTERARRLFAEKDPFEKPVPKTEIAAPAPVVQVVPESRNPEPSGIDTSDLPDDIRKVIDWPLRKILNKFGSSYSMLEWINTIKRLEDLYEKQLKNSVLEKSYIPRSYVTTHITGAIEEVFVRLLNDAPRTITAKTLELIEAGEPREKIESTVKSAISSQIKNVKNTVLQGLRNA